MSKDFAGIEIAADGSTRMVFDAAMAQPKPGHDWEKCGRGEEIGTVECRLCGNVGKLLPVYQCTRFDAKCTVDRYTVEATEIRCCKVCPEGPFKEIVT